MYTSLFSSDLFSDLDRLQRQMRQAFDVGTPSIRGFARGYPALNVGHTPEAIEIYAFAPGIDPAAIEITLDRGVLTIAGERKMTSLANGGNGNGNGDGNGGAGPSGGNATRSESRSVAHLNERFEGRFRRVVSLPDDIDPGAVTAECRDGVLHVSVKRRAAAQPRRIDVQ